MGAQQRRQPLLERHRYVSNYVTTSPHRTMLRQSTLGCRRSSTAYHLLYAFVAGLAALASVDSAAQQNLFNIPSGDLTRAGKIFYQHQLNLYTTAVESKGHFVYGLGKDWEIGANLVGKGMYFSSDWRLLHNDDPDHGALYPFLMLTAQKRFVISDDIDVNLGVQGGYNLSDRLANKKFAFFNYGLGVFHLADRTSRIVVGGYHTDDEFVGDGNEVGVMLGYEVKITRGLYLMGDWMSGDNDAAVAVLGGMYNLSKRIQICAGVMIPNPDTPKPMGLVLELNYLGWDLD